VLTFHKLSVCELSQHWAGCPDSSRLPDGYHRRRLPAACGAIEDERDLAGLRGVEAPDQLERGAYRSGQPVLLIARWRTLEVQVHRSIRVISQNAAVVNDVAVDWIRDQGACAGVRCDLPEPIHWREATSSNAHGVVNSSGKRMA